MFLFGTSSKSLGKSETIHCAIVFEGAQAHLLGLHFIAAKAKILGEWVFFGGGGGVQCI